MTFLKRDLKSKKALWESDLEVSTIEAGEYFTSLALGFRWYDYENFKEISDLRRSTTVIGHLPIHLLVLLAMDEADIKLQRKRT
jgi:hypothetical protein